jgi:sialic acid synthase SpsE
MRINKFIFDVEKTPYLIAEIGINHEGSVKRAFELVKSAKLCGAHAVKFQHFKASDLYLPKNKNFNQLKRFELKEESLVKLKNYSKKIKIDFICTAFSTTGINLLNSINVDAFKIASMDNNNHILINSCLKYKKPIIISTGMMGLSDLKKFCKIYKKYLNRFIILHCISEYPAKNNNCNLLAIDFLNKFFYKKSVIGYSDHTVGLDACKIAITQGARIIEKHFTYDNKMKKYDHIHSMNNLQLKELADFSKQYKKILGSHSFLKNRTDKKNKKYFRRGIYAKNNLLSKERLSRSNILFVRPSNKEDIDIDPKLFKKKIKNKLKAWRQIGKKNLY